MVFAFSPYLFLKETFNSQLIQGWHFRRKKACIITPSPLSLPPPPPQGYGESLHFCAGQTNTVENCGNELANRSFEFTAQRQESACKVLFDSLSIFKALFFYLIGLNWVAVVFKKQISKEILNLWHLFWTLRAFCNVHKNAGYIQKRCITFNIARGEERGHSWQ